ncbi:hypothetical protein Glove_140g62 [Diversispora epigaea]|uniref:Protein kinase domain-containing protein n=1 Tax=Diversispora epigaea TaxID=1348612 RepID=A0A397J4A3_9GLOM|nr:hypothetical protein Glove_140g62 [Diversispora epigaea]
METWMDNLIIEDIIQEENIPYYQYFEFENVKLISRNVYEAIFKTSLKTIALKCVSLNDKFILNNLTDEIKQYRKLETHDSILKFYGITKRDIIQEENIPYYQYFEFENVKLISRNVYEAIFKTSLKTIALKCVSLNDKFILNNLTDEIKQYRKLETHDSILKFYGITKRESTNNYMIILEYVNECSLRQYLKSNFQKLDWNAKLNLAKQIANVLMFLHSNDIIHGKFNSENILIHNGIIKLNVFGLTIFSDSLRFLTNNLVPMQYVDPQYLELFSTIGKNKCSDIFGLGIILWEISSGNSPFEMESSSNAGLLNNIAKEIEMAIPGTPHKYKEIFTDCWKHNEKSRPDVSQIVKNLSKIIISNASLEFETSQSQPYNDTDEIISRKFKKSTKQNEKPEIKPGPPFVNSTTENNGFINALFEIFIDIRKKQLQYIQPIMIKNYIREHKKNPVKILFEMIRHPSYYWFTSLIGFFYRYGIGTAVDYQMAFKFFSSAANEIIDASLSDSSSLRKLYNINKEIGIISLADFYFDGLGVEKDTKKAFQIYYKLANKGSLMALTLVAYCYGSGFDEAKAFQWDIKSALAGNINSLFNVGYCYETGIGVDRDENEALKWYLKAAEKGCSRAQYNLGNCYANGYGINIDQVKAFEWFKKAAENDTDGQYRLGKCFYEGYGTKKDIVKAIYWLNKAYGNGNTNAEQLLEEIIYLIMD